MRGSQNTTYMTLEEKSIQDEESEKKSKGPKPSLFLKKHRVCIIMSSILLGLAILFFTISLSVRIKDNECALFTFDVVWRHLSFFP
tara:strand:+ start:337 stop:594 length:258 start_codon:yes stop_codon:yes gene_type:complete